MPNGLVPFVTGLSKGLVYGIEQRRKEKKEEERRKREERRQAVDLLLDLVAKDYRPQEAFGAVEWAYPEVAKELRGIVERIPKPEELWERRLKRRKKEVKATAALKREIQLEDLETIYGFVDRLYGDNPQVAAAIKRYVASSRLLGITPTVKQQVDKDTGAIIRTVDLLPGIVPPSVQVIVPKEIIALKKKAKAEEEARKWRKMKRILKGVQDILQGAVGKEMAVTVKQRITKDGDLELTYTTEYTPPTAAVARVEESYIQAMEDIANLARDETNPLDPYHAASLIASRGRQLIDTLIRYSGLPGEDAIIRGATITETHLQGLKRHYLSRGNTEAAAAVQQVLNNFYKAYGIEPPESEEKEAPAESEEWLRDLMEAAGETWKELKRRFGR